MSFITLNWALKLDWPPRSSSAKALLVVLSYRARRTPQDRFECYPSIGYLLGATGQNRKTIHSNLLKLQKWGLVSDTGRRMGKTRQVIVYRVHMRSAISTGHPQKSAKNDETGPKICINTPESTAQQAQTRDTNSFYIDDGDRCFYAHAREKTGVAAVAAIPDVAAASDSEAPSQAMQDAQAERQPVFATGRKRGTVDRDAQACCEEGAA